VLERERPVVPGLGRVKESSWTTERSENEIQSSLKLLIDILVGPSFAAFSPSPCSSSQPLLPIFDSLIFLFPSPPSPGPHAAVSRPRRDFFLLTGTISSRSVWSM